MRGSGIGAEVGEPPRASDTGHLRMLFISSRGRGTLAMYQAGCLFDLPCPSRLRAPAGPKQAAGSNSFLLLPLKLFRTGTIPERI